MTCAEFKELAAACALGALEPEERAACDAHLAGATHDGCREALARSFQAATALAEALPELRPSEALFAKIQARLPQPAPRPSAVPKLPYRELFAWAVAASLLLALWYSRDERLELAQRAQAAEAAVAQSQQELTGAQGKLDGALAAATADRSARAACETALRTLGGDSEAGRKALALLDRPGTKLIFLGPAGPGVKATAAALVNVAEGRAVLLSSTLAFEEGRDFELWVIRGKNAPEAAGLMKVQGGLALGEVDPAVLSHGPFDALAISREPKGGGPTPTEVLLVGALKG